MNEEHFADAVEDLLGNLKEDFESRKPDQKQRRPLRRLQGMFKTVAWSVMSWTSGTREGGTEAEFCTMLQHALSDESHEIFTLALQFWVTINRLLVSERTGNTNAWHAWLDAQMKSSQRVSATAVVTAPYKLWRGGRIAPKALGMLESAMKTRYKDGKVRFRRAIATSTNKAVAEDFMNCRSYPVTYDKCLYQFNLDQNSDPPVQHAACLDSFSVCDKEFEVLFTPYSAFQVKKVERVIVEDDAFWLVELDAMVDNRVGLHCPSDLPVFPWI